MVQLVRRRADGQILVIFALSIVTLLGFAGLAIDGGSTFAQQRDQQTASDLAALAAANDFLLTNNETTATTRARAVADANGYTHAGDGTIVDVEITSSAGASVRVTITALHQNMMAGVLGMPTWTVTHDGNGPGRVPGHGLRRLAVHLLGDAPSATTGRRCSRRPRTSARRTATSPTASSTSPGPTSAPGNVDTHRGEPRSSRATW